MQAAAFYSERQAARGRALQAGHDVAAQYRELLQLVLQNVLKPSGDVAKHALGNTSRMIAQCVTELAAAAEGLKDDDWVDPSDPTFIAENELLGAARSIENAAKKLASLKPRKEIKGKVRPRSCACPSPLSLCTTSTWNCLHSRTSPTDPLHKICLIFLVVF
jgi:talin